MSFMNAFKRKCHEAGLSVDASELLRWSENVDMDGNLVCCNDRRLLQAQGCIEREVAALKAGRSAAKKALWVELFEHLSSLVVDLTGDDEEDDKKKGKRPVKRVRFA